MEIEQLIENIRNIGIHIVLDSDILRVRGGNEPLPDDLRQAIRNNRDAIISRLRTEALPPEAAASQTGPAADPPLPQPAESEPTPPAGPCSCEGQAREPCSQCSGSWYYPASEGWVCGMCLARKAAARATTSVSGLLELLVDCVDALAVADPEGTTTGRDWIEVFAPYQHARGMRPSPPREVWGALEELGYKVRGEDTPKPLIIGLRLILGEEG